MTIDAIILFAHGARDPSWADPLQVISKEISLLSPSVSVELAFLEFMEPSLSQVAARLHAAGHTNARLVPVFLGGAGHVLRDLPGLVEECRALYPQLKIEAQPAVGQSIEVIRAIAKVAVSPLYGGKT
jgi:sirohydrochlorin cobaltochelatase